MTKYEIEEQLVNEVLTYLSKHPYKDVHLLVAPLLALKKIENGDPDDIE